MTTRHKYQSTTDDLDALWRAVNERRKGSKFIHVPAEVLARVLVDHATIAGIVNGEEPGR